MTETTTALILVSLLLCTGTAAASAAGAPAVDHDGGEFHHGEYAFDANLSTGEIHWQGQELYVQGTASGAAYELHSVSGSGDERVVDEFVDTVPLDGSASAVVDTASLTTGEYVLLDGDGRLVRTNASGVQTGTASPTDGDAVRRASFDVVEQELTVTTDRDSAVLTDHLSFTLDSNRADYAVEITSHEFTSGELRGIFDGTETEDGTRVAVPGERLTADLSDVDTGEYTFRFAVTDVGATASETVTVSDPDEMRLTDDTVRAAAGDVATIELSMEPGDSGRLVVGSTDVGYRATVGFDDDDADGYVSLSMNTYLAGNRTGSGEARAWSAEDGDEVTDVELTTDPLDEPLAATGYDLTVRTDDEGADLGLLALEPPAVSNLTLWTAPERQFGDEFEAMTRTRTDRIAADDVVLARVNAPGVFGLLDTQPGTDDTERFRSLVGSANASFSVTLRDRSRANDDPEVDVAGSFETGAIDVSADPDNGTLLVALDQDSLRFTDGRNRIRSDDTYRIRFELDSGSEVVDRDQWAASRVEFTDRSATFDIGEDGRLELSATSNATVNGSTTVAPGTELALRVRLNGTLDRLTRTTVRSNRTFAASVDLAETRPGTNVTLSLRNFEAETDGVVRAAATEPTEPTTPISEPPVTTVDPTPDETSEEPRTEQSTTEPPSTTPPGTNTAANASDDPTGTTRATSEDGPGFGLSAAVLALVGFLLIGARRRG